MHPVHVQNIPKPKLFVFFYVPYSGQRNWRKEGATGKWMDIYKWANALVPPTPFQGWRKKCADIEPIKKPSKRLGLNIWRVLERFKVEGFKGLEGFRAGKRQTWTPIRSH